LSIGFFDSGIGGITVLYEALKFIKDEDFVYFADTKHTPYGLKSREEVRELVFSAVDYIVSQDVKAVVIACNTATSVAIEDLRQRYSIPIIGMEPAVKPAVEKTGGTDKRVLVTATPLTLKEEKLKNLIDRIDNEHIVDLLPLPGLVDFAEQFEFNEAVVSRYLEDNFSPLDMNSYGTVVLGCTHFLFYRNLFRKLLPDHIDIIDGNIGTVNHLKHILEKNGSQGTGSGKITWFCSGEQISDVRKLAEFELLMLILESKEKSSEI
jgi:glutamate racemase